MRRALTTLGFASILVVAPRAAHGSPVFELVGATGGNGGLQGRVTGADAASAYFNPALLADTPQIATLGVVVLSDQIELTLDGRPSGDVPTIVGSRAVLDPRTHAPISNDTLPTSWLERGCPSCSSPGLPARPRQGAGTGGRTLRYVMVGQVTHLFGEALAVGVHALVPAGDFTELSTFYNDEREQAFSNSLHPEFYADRMSAMSLAFGAGSRINKHLSLGVSFTLSLINTATASTYVRDPANYDSLQVNNDVHIQTSVAPHFGLLYTPSDRLRLSATVHTEQKLIIQTGISAVLPSGTQSGATLTEVHDYVPAIIAVGSEVSLLRDRTSSLSAVWTMAYEQWSQYLDRHGDRPDHFGAAFGFKDIVVPTVGARWTRDRMRLFADLSYHPTPVPPQIGASNYVDNDRVTAALGGDLTVKAWGHTLRPGISLQAHRLLPRYQAKRDSLIRDELPDGALDRNLSPIPGTRGLQTNNPGWPGFASDGWLFGGSVTLALLY